MDKVEMKKRQILGQCARWPGVKKRARALLEEFEELIIERTIKAARGE